KVFAGEPAWKAGLQEGDTIVQIGDVKNPVFRDLQTGVALGDNIEDGVDFVVQRPGVDELLKLKIYPRRRKLIPLIGMSNGHTNQVGLVLRGGLSTAGSGSVDLKAVDQIVAVNGREVSEGWQVDRALAEDRGAVTLTVERKESKAAEGQDKKAAAEQA